jgi:hypothetical protein
MPDVTLNDIANETIDNIPGEEIPTLGETVEYTPEPSKIQVLLNKVLTAETGEGSIEDYIQHPMNFKNSKGLAQMLRGFTGIIGNLKLAIVDVVFGYLRFSQEKGEKVNEFNVPGGSSFSS